MLTLTLPVALGRPAPPLGEVGEPFFEQLAVTSAIKTSDVDHKCRGFIFMTDISD
jgi:hypothetical protein